MTKPTGSGIARASELREFEVLRAFQAASCGADFRSRYGAIGTAIARRRTDGAGRKERRGSLCLLVLLGRATRGTRRDKRRPTRAAEPLPQRFEFTWRGVPHTIPVEARRIGEGSAHAATASGAGRVTSGFCEPHLGGTFGGWAWHDTSCSLVLVTCAHVVGRRRRVVTYYDDLTRSVRRAGVVGGSIPIVRGSRENVDAAIVHPDPQAVRSLMWLERIPAVLAIAAPEITDAKHARVFRYRRWHAGGGIRTGKIEAVSLNIEVGFMWDESGSTALLEDFFIVHADDGDWGAPTDSGSLLFRCEPVSGVTHHPVVGVYWGALPEKDTRPTRHAGTACRMDLVAERLGVAHVGVAPLLAFVDWLYGHAAPLDFLRLQRASDVRIRFRRGRAGQLVGAIVRNGWARSLVAPLVRHRHRITLALAQSPLLRRRAARALGPLVRGKASPKAVFAHAPARAERAALVALFRSLAALDPGIGRAMWQLCAAVNDRRHSTVGEMLRGIDAATDRQIREATNEARHQARRDVKRRRQAR